LIFGAADVFDRVGKLSLAFSNRNPAVVPERFTICAPTLGDSFDEDGSGASFEIGLGASLDGACASCDMMR
jgi:hypothetical protein